MKPERDIYFQKALKEGYLARSAYKLIQIDEVFDIFKGVTRAIDLCAAPGSWTQVIYNKLHGVVNNYDESKRNPNVKIVSVDMMPMEHFPGVIHLQADISQYATMKTIIEEFHGEKSDIVVCDGAIDVVGMKLLDYHMHHRIFISALYIVLNTLKTGGIFVIKIFIDKGHEIFTEKLKLFFQNVCIVKPHSSRNKEAFAVCQDYIPLPGFDPVQLTSYIELKSNDFSELTGVNEEVIPYLCVDSYLTKDINSRKDKVNVSEATQDLCNMINSALKDIEAKENLTKRILEKPLVYQITKDNQLVYDSQTEDFLFKDFSMAKDTVEPESIFDKFIDVDSKCSSNNDSETVSSANTNDEELQGKRLKINTVLGEKNKEIEQQNKGKYSQTEDFLFKDFSMAKDTVEPESIFDKFIDVDSKCSSNNNSETVSSANTNDEELQGERLKINTVLGEKIKKIEQQNKGKYSGLGFNLEDWTFFATDVNEYDNKNGNNLGTDSIYKDIQEINKELENCSKMRTTEIIKSLFMKQEELKSKILHHIKKSNGD